MEPERTKPDYEERRERKRRKYVGRKRWRDFWRRPTWIEIEALVPSWLASYFEVVAGLSLEIVLIATTPIRNLSVFISHLSPCIYVYAW